MPVVRSSRYFCDGAEASTSIDRRDFGVTFNIPLDGGKLLIGDKVDITLAIEAVQS